MPDVGLELWTKIGGGACSASLGTAIQEARAIMSTLDVSVNQPRPPYTPHDDQHSPVVMYQQRKRASDWQLHLADQITAFAGSMAFVWVHVGIFAFWIASGLFGVDPYPFQFLTLVVSLEAIFLSTFVLIGQNRQAALQQAKADHDFHESETELKMNTDLTRSIHTMTKQIQMLVEDVQHTVVATSANRPPAGDPFSSRRQ